MGQSVTFYVLDKTDFLKIEKDPKLLGKHVMAIESVTFDKSFEGLRYLLSKEEDAIYAEVAEKIFYPETAIGELPDYSGLDFENIPEDFDFEKLETDCIYYHTPKTITDISNFLKTISIENFANRFDHTELNTENIYPAGIWNTSTEENIAFNLNHMVEEYKNLKALFETTKNNGGYLLCFHG